MMTIRIRPLLRHVAVAAAAVAAVVAFAGTTRAAQTGCVPEDFIAWAVNRGPSVPFVTTVVGIHIERWSTEREKDRFVRTLLDRGPDALLKALREADAIGAVQSPLTPIDDIVFAWQEFTADGGRRIILIADRPMSLWEESMPTADRDNLFTVLEVRIGMNGEGEGKVAIGSNIAVDQSRGIVQLEDYAAAPVRLIYVHRLEDDHD